MQLAQARVIRNPRWDRQSQLPAQTQGQDGGLAGKLAQRYACGVDCVKE